MKFSLFLQKIYKAKNNKITKQEDFVEQLFKQCCPTFTYTPDYCKKILNGNKPLSDDLRTFVIENSDFENLPVFFDEHINMNRFNDLLDEFEIDKDEKKDLGTFSEALTYQFVNYMEYGENEIPTSVKTIYEMLLDEHGNGSIEDANEKALFSAYQHLYQAISSLTSISIKDDILTLQAPFESFFNFIYKAYRSYETKCNREGKNILVYVKDKILDGKLIIDDYLKKITEPGALPIELIKQIHFTIYDNYKFDDKDLNLSIRLFEKDEQKKILETFKNFKFYPVNEIFFTQRISFITEGKENNLLDDAFNIINRTDRIFRSIGLNLKPDYPPLVKITKELNNAFAELKKTTIQYVVDGVYYPENGTINFAPSIVPIVSMKDKSLIETGSHKVKLSKHPVLRIKEPFKTKYKLLVGYQNEVWKMSGHEDLMAELYTFNKDNTFRLFLVPVTSKARVYRLIREVSKLVYQDQMIGFAFTSIAVYNTYNDDESENHFDKMTSDQRIKIGKDVMISFAYHDEKVYGYSISKKDSKLGKKPIENDHAFPFLTPLIRHIHFCNFILKQEKLTDKKIISK
ncbi:MAG: hypothetical protein AB7E61_04185 [Acholeplasmataceae bacterium]